MLLPYSPTVPEPRRNFRVSDVEWVQTFYPWLSQHPNWWIELRFVEDRSDGAKNPPVAVRFLRDAVEIASLFREHRALAGQRAEGLKQGGSSPWPAALLWGTQPRVTRRTGREHVAAFVALAASINGFDREEWPAPQRPRVMWEELHHCPQPPSIVTWTGSGFDAWWLLREPQFDRRRGEAVQEAVRACLQSNQVQSAAGLFRWPHTVNYQGVPREPPRTVRVVWWQPEVRFAFETLHERFLPYACPLPRRSSGGCHAATWKRFQQLLQDDGDLCALWTRECGACTAHERRALNQVLARLLALHELDASDFETLASLASWNADCKTPAAELSKIWQEVRGEPRVDPATPVECRAVQAEPTDGPAARPVSPTDAPPPAALPGMLLDALPQSAWTEWAQLYLRAVGACTEAADEFHYLALVTVLGTAFGRSVVLHCGRPLYLNAYTVLVGPTGDRKSTAAQLALDLLPRVAPETLLLNGVGSQEGLMERMALAEPFREQHRTLWFVDEMASLLKKARRESSGSLLEFVTEIFHCPDFKTHTTRSRAIHLQRPTLSILAGSTPTWLEAALQEEDVLGGFTNRFVYVTGQPKSDNPMPSRPDAPALDELVAWMQRATQAADREMGWTPSARTMWCDFYAEWRRSTAGSGEHVASLLRRIDLYMLKFAAMAAAMDDVAEISATHLSAAIDLGRFLAGCTYRLLGELGTSNDCRLEATIEQKLRESHGLMRRKQLRHALGGRVSGEKLDRVLVAMERNGLVRQISETTARGAARLVQLT